MQIGPAMFVFWYITVIGWWAFAFAPLETPSLEIARRACFGAFDNGLPRAGGWLMLSSPFAMALPIWLLWGPSISASLKRWSRPLLVVLILIPLVGASAVASRVLDALRYEQAVTSPVGEAHLPEGVSRLGFEVPDFYLVDQSGNALTRDSLQGPTVVTFAFSHCKTICTSLVHQVKEAQAPMSIIITLDPWRDTPAALPGMAKRWDLPDSVRVASGTVEELQRVAQQFGAAGVRNLQTGDIEHAGLIYVLDGPHEIAYILNNPPASQVRDALQRLASEKPPRR